MEGKERKFTKKVILGVTVASFFIIAFIFTIISLVFETGIVNESTSDDSKLENTEASIDDIQSIDNESVSKDSFVDVFEDTISEQSEEIAHGWVINEYGYTYLYGDAGYEQFSFTNFTLNRYIESVASFVDLFPDDVNIYNMIVPVSSTFASIPKEIYAQDNFYNKSQSSFVSTVSSKLGDRVLNINIISSLEEKYDDGEYLFFRTDKNWTPSGAYLGYIEFCAAKGLTPNELEKFEKKTIQGYLGSFYNATGSELLKRHPDDITYYSVSPEIATELTVYDSGIIYSDYSLCNNYVYPNNSYNVFLGREAEHYKIKTNSTEGKLLIVGDSSSFPVLPFLASHYGEIDLIYPEKFQGSVADFIQDKTYDDVLLMCYSTNAVNGNYIPSFKNITGATGYE